MAPTCFGAVDPSSGSALLVLAKVTVFQTANQNTCKQFKHTHQQWPNNKCSHITTHRCILIGCFNKL